MKFILNIKIRLMILLLSLLFLLFYTFSVQAFSVGSGFTKPCHEIITVTAQQKAKYDLVNNENIPLPDNDNWEHLFDGMNSLYNYTDFKNRIEKFAAHSLFTGVRSNDTNGHSLSNLASLRSIHAAKQGQEAHCLRRTDEDFNKGNEPAVLNCRYFIKEQLELYRIYLLKPLNEQIILADFTLDFYGLIKIEVYAPIFYLGRALHTVQDSFSHTIRTDDLRYITHVLTYIEAIDDDFNERRDGIRHSDSADNCMKEGEYFAATATEASMDMLIAAHAEIESADNSQIDYFLDKWFTYKPGCNIDNNYCNSKWLDEVRAEPTVPVLENLFSCGCSVL